MNWSVAHNLSLRRTAFRDFFNEMVGGRGSSGGGNTYWMLNFTRWLHNGKHFFQTTDALDQMLAATDIGRDIPANFIRTPFPEQFIQFGETMSSPLTVWNAATQNHRAEGCYVRSGMLPDNMGSIPESLLGHGHRFIEFVFTGSSLGKSHNLDDATQAVTVAIPDEDATMLDVIEATLAADDAVGRQKHPDEAASIRSTFYHAAKILLYLNIDGVAKRPLLERSELQAKLARIKGGKRGKVERQLLRSYDRIVIGPKTAPAPAVGAAPTDGTGRHVVSCHWRRGHFRSQAYGERHSLRRPAWIAPILVNAEAAITTPTGKPYTLKT